MDPEITQELNEQFRQMTELLSQQNSLMASQVKAMQDQMTVTRNATGAIKNSSDAIGNLGSATSRLQDAQTASNEKITNTVSNMKRAFDESSNALKSFTKAALSAEDGVKKYGSAITGVGNAAWDLGKNFGILGGALGGLVKIITAFAGVALETFDNLVKFRDETTKVTGVLPTTLEGLDKLSRASGFAMDNMLKLQRITAGLGTNLTALGTTAGDGAVKFMKMANVSDAVREKFGKLGVNQERLAELQSMYVTQMSNAGLAIQLRTKSEHQLRTESLAYAENMTRLSALTGKQAEELQKERDLMMLKFEEQAKVRAENAKIKELESTGRAEDRRVAAEIRAQQKVRQTIMAETQQKMGTQMAEEVGRIIRTGAYDSITGGLSTLGIDFIGLANKVRSVGELSDLDAEKLGKDLTGQLRDNMQDAYDRQTRVFEGAYGFVGEDLGKKTGVYTETLTVLGKTAGLTNEQLEAKIQADAAALEKEKGMAADLEKVRKEERDLQVKAQAELVQLAKVLLPQVANALQTMNQSIDKVKEYLKKFSDMLEKVKAHFGTLVTVVGVLVGGGVLLGTIKAFKSITSVVKGLGSILGWLGNKIKGLFGFGGGDSAGPMSAADKRAASRMSAKEAAIAEARAGKAGGSGGLGKFGKLLGGAGRILGKVAAPIAIATTLFDAYQGFSADPGASFGGKLANAGKGALSGLTFGLSDYITGGVTTGDTLTEQDKEDIRTETKTNVTKVTDSADKNVASATQTEKSTTVFNKAINKFNEQVNLLVKFITIQGKSIDQFVLGIDSFKNILKDFKQYMDLLGFGAGGSQTLLDTIAKAEGTAGPNGYNTSLGYGKYLPGGQEQNLTGKSLNEILELGNYMRKQPGNPNSSALGRYQITGESLRDAAKGLGFDLATTKFDERTQDAMAMWLAKTGGGLNRWEGLKKDPALMAQAQAALRASTNVFNPNSDIVSLGNQLLNQGLKVTEHPSFGGVTPGVHKGRGHAENRAIDVNAIDGRDADDPVAAAKLDQIAANLAGNPNFKVLWRTSGHYDHMHIESKVQAARGGVFNGPKGGYPATLHGTELVSPLNVDSILMKLAKTPADSNTESSIFANKNYDNAVERMATNNTELITTLTRKLDSVIDALDQGNDTRKKMFRQSMV